MKRAVLLWMLLSLTSWSFASQEPQRSTAAKILSTQALWGKGFASALATLSAWNRIGQRTRERGLLRLLPSNKWRRLSESRKR
jgi:hypothetical protein